MGIIWENSFSVFFMLTGVLGGGAAWLTGRAVAITWRRISHLGVYMIVLAGAVRFFHYALFDGTLISVHYFLVDFAVLTALAGLGFRVTRARQMPAQYTWIYESAGPLWWRPRTATGSRPAPQDETAEPASGD